MDTNHEPLAELYFSWKETKNHKEKSNFTLDVFNEVVKDCFLLHEKYLYKGKPVMIRGYELVDFEGGEFLFALVYLIIKEELGTGKVLLKIKLNTPINPIELATDTRGLEDIFAPETTIGKLNRLFYGKRGI